MMWGYGWSGPGMLMMTLSTLLWLALIGVLIWAVLRMTKGRAPAGAVAFAGQVPSPAGPPDAALERARMRYAQGEIGRDEFLQVSRDLGGGEPTPPAAPPPAPAPTTTTTLPDVPEAPPSETG